MKNILVIGAIFLLGAAAGITLTLLNAPYSGKKTRKKLRDRFNETRSLTHETMSNVRARARGTVKDFQDRAQKLAHEIGDTVQPTTQKLKTAVGR